MVHDTTGPVWSFIPPFLYVLLDFPGLRREGGFNVSSQQLCIIPASHSHKSSVTFLPWQRLVSQQTPRYVHYSSEHAQQQCMTYAINLHFLTGSHISQKYKNIGRDLGVERKYITI